MQVNQIRSSFLDYFKKNGHSIVQSSPLIPSNDPTLMFTNAGMVQFKNYFTGAEIPSFKRATSAQKCLRAGGKHNDLENVGYTARHHTFFEMLGNFSFGDYFKEEAILFSWNYLTQELSLNRDKLYITIYHNDNEAFNIWKKITGFADDKIIRIGTQDNFWSMGDVGPCGPCSEIFYDHGDKYWGGLPGTPEQDGDRFVEVWNLVFMQFEQLQCGKRISLPKPSIDTGMGLERMAAVLQGTNHNYEIDLFKTLIKASQEFSQNNSEITSHRVIADHLRASSFLISDGIMPSNEGRGYVLRRIMRRAMRHVNLLGVKEPMMHKLVSTLVNEMGDAYPELKRAAPAIVSTLKLEEEKFNETLERGLKLLNSNIKSLSAGQNFPGEFAFKLYDTYGFPLDLTKDILKSHKISVDEEGFAKEMEAQKQRARAAWVGSGEKATDEVWFNIHENSGATEFLGYNMHQAEATVKAIIVDGKMVDSAHNKEAIIVLNQTPFYAESGGQVGDTGYIGKHKVLDTKKYAHNVFGHTVLLNGEIKVGELVHAEIDINRRNKIKANHSATHLLHYVLRKQLGKHITQKGSIVTEEKFRFDFSHPQPLSPDELKNIEREINQIIISNHEVTTNITSLGQAIESGAMALFGEKYDEEVRCVRMGDSFELCGGTHVTRTGDIGLFKIISEESISSGVRRIEAVTALAVLDYMNHRSNILNNIAAKLKCSQNDVEARIEQLISEKRQSEKDLTDFRIAQALHQPATLEKISNVNLIYKNLEGMPVSDLKKIASEMLKEVKEGIVIVTTIVANRVSILIQVSKNLTSQFKAQDLIKETFNVIEGKGGGNAEMAQAGGSKVNGIAEAIVKVKNYITSK